MFSILCEEGECVLFVCFLLYLFVSHEDVISYKAYKVHSCPNNGASRRWTQRTNKLQLPAPQEKGWLDGEKPCLEVFPEKHVVLDGPNEERKCVPERWG